jgi:dihydroflavonol-4-reductase
MMKKVLVTGASGFLGSNLVRELYRMDYDIRILVREDADLKGIDDIPCEWYTGNIDHKEDVYRAVRGCDIVIHAAAVTDQWGIGYEQYERVNFKATQYIVSACLDYKVAKLIYVSTANTMGPGPRSRPGTELDGFTLFRANSPYILTKYLAQQYVLEQVEKQALPAVVVNPTFMIGPYDVKPSSGKLLLYGLKKRVVLYPPGGKNFVYIQDVCTGIINAIHRGQHGDCYLLAGVNLSYREFYELLNKLAGNTALLIRIPKFVLRFAGYLGSVLRKRGRLNNTNAYLLCLDNYYSGRKAERELNVTYTPVEEAIKKTLTWFKENNYY